ncbi:MAG: TA system VapC family ribonuclease toxin [Candidatus Sulfotelmatobacter sp.]
MIVVDANLLIYSYDQSCPENSRSVAWLEGVISSEEAVGLPWQCILAFLRVVTHRGLRGVRARADEAVTAVEEWLSAPNIQILAPTDQHWLTLRRMIIEGQASGPLVSDAEIAALTIEYGGVLHTADRDFARFPGLRWVNPLQ